jgi:hypothetical protein
VISHGLQTLVPRDFLLSSKAIRRAQIDALADEKTLPKKPYLLRAYLVVGVSRIAISFILDMSSSYVLVKPTEDQNMKTFKD